MSMKVALGILIGVGVLMIGAWALNAQLDREMESEPLAERLNTLPIPEDDLVLIESWARDGSRGIQNREPEAGRLYLAAGTVDDGCRFLDEFYAGLDVTIRPTSRSGDPSDWCGRSIQVASGRVSVWVEEPQSWTPIPDQLEEISNLVKIEYRAHR